MLYRECRRMESEMRAEDEAAIKRLITDYMCWWDDRLQHKDYPSQLDENATWELWQSCNGENKLLMKYVGKEAVVASKAPGIAIVHSISNFVIRPTRENEAEVRAYFRTYFRENGELYLHGEGRYEVRNVAGEWRLMSIRNQNYWIRDTARTWRPAALRVMGILIAAMIMGAIGGALVATV
jgi:hypothetical protein